MTYSVSDYGAVGDGVQNDGPAIQRAIDACHENGGGRVLLEGGRTYRAGTVILRSYVELHLEMGAVLKGSDCLQDYNVLGKMAELPKDISVPTYENCEYAGEPALFFIYAKDAEFVSITGFGKIDGNESIFHGSVTRWHIDGRFYPRVPLIFVEHATHLTMKDVTLTGSAFWTTHLVGCEDVLIDGIRILNSLKMANCDGIDPDHCRNVRIQGCHIECADDCIVFKNTANAMEYGPCENITVTGCTLVSTSAAIKFGTESEALFRNIVVENCCISRTNRAISLQLRDRGSIENVLFSNITIDTRLFSKDHWWGKAEPIAVTALRRKRDSAVGTIRGVTFSNIRCSAENGILLYGEDNNISDIRFENVSLRLENKTKRSKNYHDLRPCPDNTISEGALNAVYARNVSDVTFTNFRVSSDDYMRSVMGVPVDAENVKAFTVNGRTPAEFCVKWLADRAEEN